MLFLMEEVSMGSYKSAVLSPGEIEHKKNSSISLVLGIIGDVLVWYPIIGIAGLVLSVLALIRSNRNRLFAQQNGVPENGMNVAAKWCGVGGVLVGGILAIIYIIVFIVLLLIAIGIIEYTGK